MSNELKRNSCWQPQFLDFIFSNKTIRRTQTVCVILRCGRWDDEFTSLGKPRSVSSASFWIWECYHSIIGTRTHLRIQGLYWKPIVCGSLGLGAKIVAVHTHTHSGTTTWGWSTFFVYFCAPVLITSKSGKNSRITTKISPKNEGTYSTVWPLQYDHILMVSIVAYGS